MYYGYGFDMGFGGFQVMFSIVFLVIICVFVTILVKNIGEWGKNNQSPRLTVDATVVTKRGQILHHNHAGDSTGYHTSTSYYVTFQVESGDRMEFHVEGTEYGMLVEGDKGRLSFQGTRYLGFERSV